MKKLTVGILAHVDAGKTTLCEAMLYTAGQIRKLGRVDHGDAFLDTDVQERERGITIFSKQARIILPDLEIQLLDTPGHVDFSAETERTLQVLDYAILLISGTDGVQSHTRTLWNLLERYSIPTFLFVNKMDLSGADRRGLMEQLREKLHGGCTDFSDPDAVCDAAAMCDEALMEAYLETGAVPREAVAEQIARRNIFPCFFGSALRLEGVEDFLRELQDFTLVPSYPAAFAARVYKIGRDPQGNRLTYLKITGGSLRVREPLKLARDSAIAEEKVNQIRLYSGSRFETAEEVPAGTVCAVTGLSLSRIGDGLGADRGAMVPVLEPVMTYELELPQGVDAHGAWGKLSQLQEEDPLLHLDWQEKTQSIRLQLMGEVQMEVLQRAVADRFGWQIRFGEGRILYRETIAKPVEGIGHFEPLRHYAEVHLYLEPGEPGSGITVESACSTDDLAAHWQNLIETHLLEREHPGVLTGSAVTDLRVTILCGKAHEKHTEGGDFRQATYRALRHGLMQAQSILLEPWYRFRLELPTNCLGRAITDLQRMNGELETPETIGELSALTGSVPVAALQGYAAVLASYTRGEGHLFCEFSGYAPCTDRQAVIDAVGYDAERDVDHPADSVFCSHGAAVIVPWQEVEGRAHLPSLKQKKAQEKGEAVPAVSAHRASANISFEQDKELQRIFERTYGEGKSRSFVPQQEVRRREVAAEDHREIAIRPPAEEYLLVDGYNIIFAWEELKAVARDDLAAARTDLLELLCNYQGFRKSHVIVVFDAYRVPRKEETVMQYRNITVVYTKEKQTADSYIEKATYQIAKEHSVRVATSDGAEQMIILGHGALRVPASALYQELVETRGEIRSILEQVNRRENRGIVRRAMEKAGYEKE